MGWPGIDIEEELLGSRCGLCDVLVRGGDDIEMYADEWCHVACIETEEGVDEYDDD